MFHRIVEKKIQTDNFTITKLYFETFIEKKLQEEIWFTTIENLLNDRTDKKVNSITFDDGYMEVYQIAYPYLLEKKIPFTIFVITDLIGTDGYLGEEQLRELLGSGLCTIGSHTCSHSMMRFLNEEDCFKELKDSKLRLEQITGRPVEIIAYPYGSVYACSMREQYLAKKAGYKLALSTINAPINKVSVKKNFFLPRENVYEKK